MCVVRVSEFTVWLQSRVKGEGSVAAVAQHRGTQPCYSLKTAMEFWQDAGEVEQICNCNSTHKCVDLQQVAPRLAGGRGSASITPPHT